MRTPLVPPSHPIFGHLPFLSSDPLGFLTQCARESEPIVPLRIPFLPTFLLLNAEDIERVLVTEHRQFVKPLWLRTPAVRRLLGDGLVTSDGDPWRQQRRECQPAFLPGLIPGYAETIAALAERTLDRWSVGEIRDIQHDMAGLTLEVIGQTLLGCDLAEQTEEIGAAMDTLMDCFTARHSLFGLIPWLPTPRESRAVRRLDHLVDTMISNGLAGKSQETQCPVQSNNFLGMLASHHHRGGQEEARQLREQVKTFLAAGHESSALALTWAFILLAQHPEIESHLATELRTVLKDRTPGPNDLINLPYTQAIVKETLRLFPPLWMTGRKSMQACEIGGIQIPKGALLLTSQWAVQRSPRYFQDPDVFWPERWNSPETADLPRYAYFPFGGGPRVCIGQGFAMTEMVILLAAIASRFRLTLLDDQEVFPWATMTLRAPVGRRMRVTKR